MTEAVARVREFSTLPPSVQEDNLHDSNHAEWFRSENRRVNGMWGIGVTPATGLDPVTTW